MTELRGIDALEVGFVPTVTDHDRYTDGMLLETIDPDPDRNVYVFDDDRDPCFTGEIDL